MNFLQREENTSDERIFEEKYFLPYFESQLSRVFSARISDLHQHIIETHTGIRDRNVFQTNNQWSLQSLPNKYNRMRLIDIRELFSRSINFRGVMFELFHNKAQEFLRKLTEMGKYGHNFQQTTIARKRLSCKHMDNISGAMINDFFGVFTESRSEPECNCDSDKILNNMPMFREFLTLILKADYLSEDETLQKFVDLLLIERFQESEIKGCMTIISAILNRCE